MSLLAHGTGGSTDLPIPYTYALIGAAWALTLTFALVALGWRKPRFDPTKPGLALPRWTTAVVDARATRAVVALLGLAFTAWVLLAAIGGPQNNENPLPGTFYVLLWVGLPTASVLLGPVWRVISPLRTVSRLIPPRAKAIEYPSNWGYWPAALGLFAFVWLELASPNSASLTAIKLWLLLYTVIMLCGAGFFGRRWFTRGDPFEVYSLVASRLSPLRRGRRDRLIVVGNPLDHLPSLPVLPGTVAVLALLLGSTAFDSFSAMPKWRTIVDATSAMPGGATLTRTAGLLGFALIVGISFCFASRAPGGVVREARRLLPGLLPPSPVPIWLGYVFAHYLSYLVERGQQTVIRLSDPLDRGWNLLGLGHADVSYVLSMHPGVLATIKVACVVAGHMAGVVAAHDAALRLLPKGHQLTGQLAMMLVMVGYTFTGLYLLFGG